MMQGLFDRGSVAIVRVAVPLAVPMLLDYLWDVPDAQPVVGGWARVPVGGKFVDGVICELLAESPFKNLKRAEALVDVPKLSAETLAFYRWVARYTLSAPGEPLRVALPRAAVPEAPAVVMGVALGDVPPGKAAKSFAKVQGVLAGASGGVMAPSLLAAMAGVSSSTVRALLAKGILKEVPMPEGIVGWHGGVSVRLSEAQAGAAKAVKEALGGFSVFLLDGVTGSGKTEVYFEVIQQVLSSGKGQVLVLVPEIALTPQWLERFEARFGVRPWVWHSGLAEGARRATWWHVARGDSGVVVGARSALFLPWQALKLTVVDEEHDPSYKQDDGFRYHGRDMAVQLARMWKAPVVLASATPSLETYSHAKSGKYVLLELPSRHGGARMPEVHLLDMRGVKLPSQEYLSPKLREAMQRALDAKEQVLLFLNRRGVAPVLLCRACGHRRDCPRCDATLVVHGEVLTCHHCGYSEKRVADCPACGEPEMKPFGPGTQRVAAEAARIFPEARVVVADTDVAGTPKQMDELVQKVLSREVDIVVGTQMVTKGHHFPHLTCVGVVDADMGLAHGDLRAAERTYQLLAQVAGRAGRAHLVGGVWVQTTNPSHPLFVALTRLATVAGRDAFYEAELAAREAWGAPPYGRQVALIFKGKHRDAVVAAARGFARVFGGISAPPMRLLGPAPAPMERVNDWYRWRILLKGEKVEHAFLVDLLGKVPVPTGVDVMVDVDPSVGL